MTATTARIQAARDEIAAQIRAYRDLVGAASKASGMSLTRIDAALAAFEPAFFDNLLIALHARFPVRAGVGKASVEVALLVDALLHRGGVFATNPAWPYDSDDAVLRIEPGERIALNADDFEALCAAFLAELDGKAAG